MCLSWFARLFAFWSMFTFLFRIQFFSSYLNLAFYPLSTFIFIYLKRKKKNKLWIQNFGFVWSQMIKKWKKILFLFFIEYITSDLVVFVTISFRNSEDFLFFLNNCWKVLRLTRKHRNWKINLRDLSIIQIKVRKIILFNIWFIFMQFSTLIFIIFWMNK